MGAKDWYPQEDYALDFVGGGIMKLNVLSFVDLFHKWRMQTPTGHNRRWLFKSTYCIPRRKREYTLPNACIPQWRCQGGWDTDRANPRSLPEGGFFFLNEP